MRVKIVRQEFPYDIGIWSNIKQGMGTRNVFAWLWPFAASPSVESGLRFEVNGFEASIEQRSSDPDTTWPPPDPDRMPRVRRRFDPDTAFVHGDTEVEAFRQRQAEDLKRYTQPQGTIHRRLPFHKRFSDPNTVSEYGVEDVGEEDFSDGINEVEEEEEEEGEEAWRNSEGERLGDFGVDEDVEFYDEDDIPLAELIRRRKSARIADVARKAQ
ncbi:Palmitoyltransferase [Cryomyces antarcticus]|nr:Palmitoyltransferase [Cryomyces antarcticus]